MVNVANGSNVNMRLITLVCFFCHFDLSVWLQFCNKFFEFVIYLHFCFCFFFLPRIGIEPTTTYLPCKCSTTELSGQATLNKIVIQLESILVYSITQKKSTVFVFFDYYYRLRNVMRPLDRS